MGLNKIVFFVFCLLFLFAGPTWAHKSSDGFLYIDAENNQARYDIALRDLLLVTDLDLNGDRTVTGNELTNRWSFIEDFATTHLTFMSDSGNCGLRYQDRGIARHSDGVYASLTLDINCKDGEAPSVVAYTAFAEQDPLHRGLINVSDEASERLLTAIPGGDAVSIRLDPSENHIWSMFLTFIYEGIVHLLIGLDHILFLLVLIIPATLRAAGITSAKERVLQLVGIVTAFTVAHSITLALAALDIVRLPIAWVETVIALSIVLAAINVWKPILGEKTWKLAFGFGLIHGFGFASVLGDLTSGVGNLAVALAGFNIGVELGQLALIVVLFPVLYAMGDTAFYRKGMVPVALLVVSIISINWVIERAPVSF
ncbi:HupE/UreJ family protein [Marinobacter adhaerens]|uniref:HupE/UreJ family protein n=1 Tax=Marinobacter adhaerens TaxID=1033846 RepID=UPI0002F6AB54|nr:HupE/UreJ family protein [Marinobacter adhaerens]MBW4980282.1 HupE/UreJ family protein [Marinobacter adhaerens]